MRLLIATQNQDKQREYLQLLNDLKVDLVFPQDVNLGEVDVAETGETISDNALLKAQAFAQQSGLPTLADDYGLAVTALKGAPGVKAKRFHPGSDRDRNLKVLELLKDKTDRSAQTICAVCFADPNGKTHCAQAIYQGQISAQILEGEGFGYDSIFIPAGESKTLAQLGQKYKNKNSHRALAIQKMKDWLQKQELTNE